MAGPFIYIGTYTIKDGMGEEAKRRLHQLVELVEKNEPRLIAFNLYFDEAGTTAGVVQVHPDAASMETHMKVISDHLSDAFDDLDTVMSEQVYGTPSDALAAMLRAYADPNASTTFLPLHEAGFTRAAAS
jgi:cob(I)alamin adenosyltransferase